MKLQKTWQDKALHGTTHTTQSKRSNNAMVILEMEITTFFSCSLVTKINYRVSFDCSKIRDKNHCLMWCATREATLFGFCDRNEVTETRLYRRILRIQWTEYVNKEAFSKENRIKGMLTENQKETTEFSGTCNGVKGLGEFNTHSSNWM